jgi:putative hemolysin
MRSGRHDAPLPRRGIRLAAALSLILASCSGPLNDGVYRGEGFAFRVPPTPEGWQRIEVSHAALAYRDADGGTIAVNTRCHEDGGDVSLAALTQHLFIGFTDREILEQTVVPFDGREAMHTLLSAKLDGVPQRFDVWVMKKDDCVHDLYYIAAPAHFERGAATFERFVQGFATVPNHAD